MRKVNIYYYFLAVFVIMMVSSPLDAADKPLFEASLRLDLGADRGQNFGTLFEVADADGRTVIGAGFPGVFNTQGRNERYNLQFFVRPPEDQPQFTLQPHSKPDPKVSGAYVYDVGDRLYSSAYGIMKRYDREKQAWVDEAAVDPAKARFGDGIMRIGDGVLTFTQSTLKYNGQVVLPPPAEGERYCWYYGGGHLCFYYTKPGTGDGRTSLYACPWEPESGKPIDLAQAKALTLQHSGETPFAWGQLRDQVVTCSNLGGFYVFEGDWRVLRAPDKSVSYQIYTMVNYGDKLLMGQYPTGHLHEYDGVKMTHLPGWPPVMPGVSTGARECQTAALYRGELYVGVWPWGEIWRYDRDRKAWAFVARAFTRPELTDKWAHPYEENIRAYNEANGTDLVPNDWGHRVTGLVPKGTELFVSTSSKGPSPRNEKLDFLTEEVFAEYGRVHTLSVPGNLSVNMADANKPMELRFVVTADRMTVYRDGKVLAEAKLEPGLVKGIEPKSIQWREGVFGRLCGEARGLKGSL